MIGTFTVLCNDVCCFLKTCVNKEYMIDLRGLVIERLASLGVASPGQYMPESVDDKPSLRKLDSNDICGFVRGCQNTQELFTVLSVLQNALGAQDMTTAMQGQKPAPLTSETMKQIHPSQPTEAKSAAAPAGPASPLNVPAPPFPDAGPPAAGSPDYSKFPPELAARLQAAHDKKEKQGK